MDCRIIGSLTRKKAVYVPFLLKMCFPQRIYLKFKSFAYLAVMTAQLAISSEGFKPLPIMAVTSVYLSLPLAGMHDQRKC